MTKLRGERVMNPLSPQEIRVLVFIAEGYTTVQIARKMKLGEQTVRNHVEHMRHKLSAPNRPAAIATAFRRGILT